MVCTKPGMEVLETRSLDLRLRNWLKRINLRKSNIIVVSRLSREFEEATILYIEATIHANPMHFFSFHLSLDHAASMVLSRQDAPADFKDLIRYQKLIFLHDVEALSSIRKFIGRVRSDLEKEDTKVVLTMRPATTYEVYRKNKAPLWGRVVRIEEPNLSELEIKDRVAMECGLLDVYKAYAHDNFDRERATKSKESASFNVLNLFWYFLINDSRKAGSVRVVASCLAHHDQEMTIAAINKKCGIKHGRQAVHAALKTGLMKMTKDTPKKACIYPPLLKLWIKANIPFYPVHELTRKRSIP